MQSIVNSKGKSSIDSKNLIENSLNTPKKDFQPSISEDPKEVIQENDVRVKQKNQERAPSDGSRPHEAFLKYSLTTDIPFEGVRTTKAKIEPVKTLNAPPKVLLNPKITEETPMSMTPLNMTPSKKMMQNRTRDRFQTPQAKALNGSDSKPDKSARKNFDKESQSNLEKGTPKQENSLSKNSLEHLENENKEKNTFLTEAGQSQSNVSKKQFSRETSRDKEDLTDNDFEDHNSEHLEDKQDTKLLKSVEDSKETSKGGSTYDPYAVLNKYRSKRIQGRLIKNRKADSQNRIYSKSPESSDFLNHTKSSPSRDFTVIRSKNSHLFEGVSYVPYDIFLRQDRNMQAIMIKDLLKILMDKAKGLHKLFNDNYRIAKIMRNIGEAEQSALNLHTEETIGLLNAIASIIMQEFKESAEKIGIKPSPILNPNLKTMDFEDEVERFHDNCNVFIDTTSHLRDCMDCYQVMARQNDRKPLSDSDCSDLLQFIARARYNLGQLSEAFRVLEKHVDGKLMWEQEEAEGLSHRMMKSDSILSSKVKSGTSKCLTDLLQHKFNLNKTKSNATRESKVVLNQEAEDEKFLLILQKEKLLKKRQKRTVVDSRKLFISNRLLNPIEDPQVKNAMKIAYGATKVQLSKELLESLGQNGKDSENKDKKNELPFIKNSIEKILSNKKITELCFDFHDEKEVKGIIENLSSRNKTFDIKELLGEVFSHTKSPRHLVCLFDKEALNNSEETLRRPRSLKLPKIHRNQ